MAVTCHLRNPKTFAEQKAGLGSEEKNWGGNPQKGLSDTINKLTSYTLVRAK